MRKLDWFFKFVEVSTLLVNEKYKCEQVRFPPGDSYVKGDSLVISNTFCVFHRANFEKTSKVLVSIQALSSRTNFSQSYIKDKTLVQLKEKIINVHMLKNYR